MARTEKEARDAWSRFLARQFERAKERRHGPKFGRAAADALRSEGGRFRGYAFDNPLDDRLAGYPSYPDPLNEH